MVENHCADCHGGRARVKGGVNLVAIEDVASLEADPELLQALIDVIDLGEMPPEDKEPLAEDVRSAILGGLNGLWERAIASDASFPAIPVRRMTRMQYNNAVQDLFDLNVAVFSLPERMLREHGNYFQPATGVLPEQVRVGSRPLGKSQLIEPRLAGVAAYPQDLRAEHGYDTQADHLSMSPLLMERFLDLGRAIVESHDFNPRTSGQWEALFGEAPEGASARDVLETRLRPFLTRAFRRPVDETTLSRYVDYAMTLTSAGSSVAEAMKETVIAVLASPRFLYLYDRAAEPGPSVDAFELASRLSFFLAGSLPDEPLHALASSGQLLEPETLRGEVERLLRDERLKRFCDSFPAQWLQLDRIVSAVPDPERHPDFYYLKYRVSMDMMMEPLLLFEAILVENRSILEFIDSPFTYRSNRLRAWYGEADPGRFQGPVTMDFVRMPTPSRREGGVITTAATMTMTSGPRETKPITRGAWVASVVFNDPPEPPPADVPPLPKDPEALANLTLRERLAAHREAAACAGCHEKIDPLGFALENFDEAGQWREAYENGRAIDTSGTLFRRHDFTDVVGFKDAILEEKERFVRAFASHLMAYALGRPVAPADAPSLDAIVAATVENEFRIHSLIHALVQSPSFRSRGPAEEPLSE